MQVPQSRTDRTHLPLPSDMPVSVPRPADDTHKDSWIDRDGWTVNSVIEDPLDEGGNGATDLIIVSKLEGTKTISHQYARRDFEAINTCSLGLTAASTLQDFLTILGASTTPLRDPDGTQCDRDELIQRLTELHHALVVSYSLTGAPPSLNERIRLLTSVPVVGNARNTAEYIMSRHIGRQKAQTPAQTPEPRHLITPPVTPGTRFFDRFKKK
ncbi:hypothetical protein HYS00_03605 [Candidatus Microgenomates bacterium]|nr:hypothetical protein [Candidatus Microgenomates bacterium]